MAKGRELAEFTLQCSTATCTAGPAGSKLIAYNFDGEVSGGFGAIIATATIDTGNGGNMEFCGVMFRDDGRAFNSSATGTYQSIGIHRWSTDLLMHSSDGSVMLGEGVIDLASRSWRGHFFEWLAEPFASGRPAKGKVRA